MRERSEEAMRRELVRRGARRLKKVSFRRNRSTIWSLTQDATVLNLHEAYRRAPAGVLDAFVTIVKARGRRTDAVRAATRSVREWQGLEPALSAVRKAHARALLGEEGCGPSEALHGCATAGQRRYLRALYRYLNDTRFGGRLPKRLPIRLSSRMHTSLGHMVPAVRPDGGRYVAEIALNVDLMLPGNGAERLDTLLHEMAHVADYLTSGNYGHGSTWKAWARKVGCRAETIYDRPVVHRPRRDQSVTRVPPLPPALLARAARDGSRVRAAP
ncbi:MAG: SprT family zinc-dependent metalloprotease [Gemmatimonadota bacterium]|jgi:hypothetical protein